MFEAKIKWTTVLVEPNNEQLIIIKLSPIKFLYCMKSAEIKVNEDTIEYEWDIISCNDGHTHEEISLWVEKVRDGDSIYYCDPRETEIYLTMAHGILGQWLDSEILGYLPANSILE